MVRDLYALTLSEDRERLNHSRCRSGTKINRNNSPRAIHQHGQFRRELARAGDRGDGAIRLRGVCEVVRRDPEIEPRKAEPASLEQCRQIATAGSIKLTCPDASERRIQLNGAETA